MLPFLVWNFVCKLRNKFNKGHLSRGQTLEFSISSVLYYQPVISSPFCLPELSCSSHGVISLDLCSLFLVFQIYVLAHFTFYSLPLHITCTHWGLNLTKHGPKC